MNPRENILCFKHCCSNFIFCKKIPEKCPICICSLSTQSLEPFIVPYPLESAKSHACSIIIRPSMKSFLENYSLTDDLHIGITNSSGNIIEYDKCGLIRNDNEKWKSCAAITFIPNSWQSFWDEILTATSNDPIWNISNYNDITFNCFDFVIAFLKNLKYNDIQFMNKEEMCEIFILPKIQNVLKYASVHQQLKEKDFYLQE